MPTSHGWDERCSLAQKSRALEQRCQIVDRRPVALPDHLTQPDVRLFQAAKSALNGQNQASHRTRDRDSQAIALIASDAVVRKQHPTPVSGDHQTRGFSPVQAGWQLAIQTYLCLIGHAGQSYPTIRNEGMDHVVNTGVELVALPLARSESLRIPQSRCTGH